MQYNINFPGLYCLSGGTAVNVNSIWKKVVKNGSSWYLSNRKSAAFTYFPKTPTFTHIIILDPNYSTFSDYEFTVFD